MDILADIFGGIWQGFLAMFGMSDAQKLGRAEVTVKDQAKTIQEISNGKAIETSVLNEPVGAADAWLHSHGRKQ